jgi:hypothetical protein
MISYPAISGDDPVETSPRRTCPPPAKPATSDNADAEKIQAFGDLFEASFFSMDLDPDALKQAVSDQGKVKNRAWDKRIAAIAIALVLLIFSVDLLVQYI